MLKGDVKRIRYYCEVLKVNVRACVKLQKSVDGKRPRILLPLRIALKSREYDCFEYLYDFHGYLFRPSHLHPMLKEIVESNDAQLLRLVLESRTTHHMYYNLSYTTKCAFVADLFELCSKREMEKETLDIGEVEEPPIPSNRPATLTASFRAHTLEDDSEAPPMGLLETLTMELTQAPYVGAAMLIFLKAEGVPKEYIRKAVTNLRARDID